MKSTAGPRTKAGFRLVVSRLACRRDVYHANDVNGIHEKIRPAFPKLALYVLPEFAHFVGGDHVRREWWRLGRGDMNSKEEDGEEW
jgi:hypothetical protein